MKNWGIFFVLFAFVILQLNFIFLKFNFFYIDHQTCGLKWCSVKGGCPCMIHLCLLECGYSSAKLLKGNNAVLCWVGIFNAGTKQPRCCVKRCYSICAWDFHLRSSPCSLTGFPLKKRLRKKGRLLFTGL